MPKKQKKKNQDAFHQYDPAVPELANKRAFGGKQIYDYKIKRLHSYIRDDSQGRAVLIEAMDIAREKGFNLRLSYLEKRLLKRLGETVKYTEILGLAFCLSTLWMLTNMDCDGDSDIVPQLTHQLEPDPSSQI
jgi:hypothetical protein